MMEGVRRGHPRLQRPWLPRGVWTAAITARAAREPGGAGAIEAKSAFNTAISFATNTNWQGYGGETTMSYLTQMLGLGVQNFLSAATGIAVLAALIRGLSRKSSATIGNCWADLTRVTLYILLPLSAVLAIALVSQGVVQTFARAARGRAHR